MDPVDLRLCVSPPPLSKVPGDFLEAGVFRGGTSIIMNAVLACNNVTGRTLWLADSFAGLPDPLWHPVPPPPLESSQGTWVPNRGLQTRQNPQGLGPVVEVPRARPGPVSLFIFRCPEPGRAQSSKASGKTRAWARARPGPVSAPALSISPRCLPLTNALRPPPPPLRNTRPQPPQGDLGGKQESWEGLSKKWTASEIELAKNFEKFGGWYGALPAVASGRAGSWDSPARPRQTLPGWFKDTLPTAPVSKVAFLRCDADMYSSTLECLQFMYPLLPAGGLVYIDDYHEFEACRRAVDEYRASAGSTGALALLFH